MKVLKCAVSGILCVALTGCFDMQQDFVFRDDGTAQMNLKVAVAASMLAMSSQNDSPQDFCPNELPGAIPPEVSFRSERYSDRGDAVCEMAFTGTIASMMRIANPGDVLSAGDNPSASNMRSTLEEVPEGYRLSLSFEIPDRPTSSGPDDGMAAMGQQMIIAAMAGRSLGWTVHAPQIISTTGRLSDDGKTASYYIPLAEAFVDAPREYSFEVVFSADAPGPLDWIQSIFR